MASWSDFDLRWDPRPSLVVVMAANGYPGAYAKGTEIRGLDRAAAVPGVQVFHAGTARRADGAVVANGGRVLGIAATGADAAGGPRRGLCRGGCAGLAGRLLPAGHRPPGA